MDSGNTGTAWEAQREAAKEKGINGNGFGLILLMAAQLATWPTPGAKDGAKSVRSLEGAEREALRKGWGNDLCTAAMATWPTPTTRDWKDVTDPDSWNCAEQRNRFDQLGRAVWLTQPGPASTGSPAETAKPGQLNPAFSRWLMGLPPEWDDCAPTATPSSRKSRPAS
jgi:hypothetical protein